MHRLSARLERLEQTAGDLTTLQKAEMGHVFRCFMDWDACLRSKTPGLTNEDLNKGFAAGGLSHPDIRRMIEVVYLYRKERGTIDDPTLEDFNKREVANIFDTWKF